MTMLPRRTTWRLSRLNTELLKRGIDCFLEIVLFTRDLTKLLIKEVPPVYTVTVSVKNFFNQQMHLAGFAREIKF